MNQELTSIILIVKDVTIGIAAFVGMGFGIYNFFRDKSKEKVKLKVIPKSVIGRGTSSSGQEFIRTSQDDFPKDYISDIFAIEVINFSDFPVTVNEVGFLIKGTDKRFSLPMPIIPDQKEWPRKLEKRESVTVYGDLQGLLSASNIKNVEYAFARTSCNSFGKGTNNALKELVIFSKNTKNKQV
jgi:hypothetical protein